MDNSLLFCKIIYLWRNNILNRALHCSKESVSLCCPAGEMSGRKKAFFLFYPDFEIANFQQGDRDNVNAHSVYNVIWDNLSCTHMRYMFSVWEYCFFVHSCEAFGDAWNRWAGQNLTLSLCTYTCWLIPKTTPDGSSFTYQTLVL